MIKIIEYHKDNIDFLEIFTKGKGGGDGNENPIFSDCELNGTFLKYTTRVEEHIEAKHYQSGLFYQCQVCSKQCKTKNALKCHVYRAHNKNLN